MIKVRIDLGLRFLKYIFLLTLSAQTFNVYAITNGIEINENEFPSVVSLYDTEQSQTYCTGTFISPRVVLTAYHCFDENWFMSNRETANITLVKNGNMSFKILDFKFNPLYDEDGLSDILLLYVDKNSQHYSKILNSKLSRDQEVSLVGFGISFFNRELMNEMKQMNEGEETKKAFRTLGIKRLGTNIIDEVKKLTISFNGRSTESLNIPKGEMSGACKGDSGGPLFNRRGEIIGVARELGDFNLSGIHKTEYVNLLNPKIREFIHESVSSWENLNSN